MSTLPTVLEIMQDLNNVQSDSDTGTFRVQREKSKILTSGIRKILALRSPDYRGNPSGDLVGGLWSLPERTNIVQSSWAHLFGGTVREAELKPQDVFQVHMWVQLKGWGSSRALLPGGESSWEVASPGGGSRAGWVGWALCLRSRPTLLCGDTGELLQASVPTSPASVCKAVLCR